MNNLFEYKDFRGHVDWDQENDADHWEPPGDLIVKDEEEILRDVVESQEKCDGTNNLHTTLDWAATAASEVQSCGILAYAEATAAGAEL